MNRLDSFGLSVLLFFGLSTNAQNKETPGDDASAVRSTVTNYIEAYYTGNAALDGTNAASSLPEAHDPRRKNTDTREEWSPDGRRNSEESASRSPGCSKERAGDGPRYCRRHRVGQAGDTRMDGLYDAIEGRWQLKDSFCRAAHRLVRRVHDCVFRDARSPERHAN